MSPKNMFFSGLKLSGALMVLLEDELCNRLAREIKLTKLDIFKTPLPIVSNVEM